MSILPRDPHPDDVPSALVCLPVGGGRPVAGSTRTTCAQCGRAVWLAPSGRALLQEHPTLPVLCLADGRERMRIDPQATLLPPTPAQWREIVDNQLRQRRN